MLTWSQLGLHATCDAALVAERGPIGENAHRLGEPPVGALDGLSSARRADYRIVTSIDDASSLVTVHRIQRRRFPYRPH